MGNLIKIEVGTKFNRLTFVSEAGFKNKKRVCNWVCDCGNDTVIRLDAVKSGDTSSCGCFHKEQSSKSMSATFKKHGFTKLNIKLVQLLTLIKQRCYNEKCKEYKWYGGKGIKVCEEWIKNPSVFYEWCILNGWEKGLQIDRENNNGNYEPNNCRFVTREVNCNNRSSNVYFDFHGEKKTIAEISRIVNIKQSIIRQRINRDKMDLYSAIKYKKP
jgi:hypothetical protein